MQKVSFFAKWLSSIKTRPSSSSNSCIHSILIDSCKNHYLLLVVLSQLKITLHRVAANAFLHNQPDKPTNIFSHNPNSIFFSLLMTANSFKAYDLRISIHSIHTIDQFKPITNTEFQNQASNHWII